MSNLELYQTLKKKYQQLPELQRAKCCLSEEIIKTPEQLDEKLKDFSFDQGWLCYQSNIIKLDQTKSINIAIDVAINAQTEEGGILLYGELANSQQSLHIRQHLYGTWKLITLQEKAAETEKYLSENLSFIAMPESVTPEIVMPGNRQQKVLADEKESMQPYLYYRRYSKQRDDKGYQPYAARFIGFTKDEE